MKKALRKTLSLICIIAVLFSINLSVHADIGGGSGTGVLSIAYDTATPQHKALTMTVDPTDTTSPLQAFCIGWTFVFKNLDGSMSNTIYVPLSEVVKNGASKTFTFPINDGWTLGYTGITGGKSIRDLSDYQWTYDQITTKGNFTVDAYARIEKFSYSNGNYTSLGVYANSKEDIDSKFTEFSDTFKTNVKNNYYPDTLTFTVEPPDPSTKLPTPTVTLTAPEDGSTYYVGATIPFTGTGTNCDHIAGLINGNTVSTQQGNSFNSNYTASKTGKITFQVIGRNTANADDPGSKTASSQIATVNVIDKPSGVYTVVVHYVEKQADGSIKQVAPDETLYIQHQDGQEVVLAIDGKVLTADKKVIFTAPDFNGYSFDKS